MSHWKKKNNRRGRGAFAVSPAFLLLLVAFSLLDRQPLLTHILLAAALHECAHVSMLYLVGGKIDFFRITLFGAELRISHSERLSYGREILSVLAGPGANLVCALVLSRLAEASAWDRGYMIAGIHGALALFNLLPVRPLDGGRMVHLLLCWVMEPITAERFMHIWDCAFLCAAVFFASLLHGMAGPQMPLLLLQIWFVLCWCTETGIVKPELTR